MSRERLFIAAAVAAGCIAVLLMGACTRGSSGQGAYYYHAGQHALVQHDLKTAAADFQRAIALTNDPDKRAWAQYQLAACYEVQPSKRSQAITALRSLIQFEPHHFLAARAQTDLDRLEGAKSHPITPPALDVDCGPESLAYIIEHSFNRPVSLSTLRHLAGTNSHGTSLLGLQIAAEKCDLSAAGMKADMNYLRRMRPPAILWTRRSHFIAFLGTQPAITPPFWGIRVYDPAGTREEVLTPEELQTMWDGYLLKLSVPRKA